MKKIIALLLTTLLMFCAVGCGKSDTGASPFIELTADQTLFIGTDDILRNFDDERETEEYLEYISNITYTLNRSYYQQSDSVEYAGWYYYWNISETTSKTKIGTKKVTYQYRFSYLPLGADNLNVLVKKIIKTITEYSYSGGMINKPYELTVNLNGYFTSQDAMKNSCVELYNKVERSGTRKYNVSVVDTVDYSYTINNYNSYYYIETI